MGEWDHREMTDEAFLESMQDRYPGQVDIGKVSGQVRMHGPALRELRLLVYFRDRVCQHCKLDTYFEARWKGDPLAYDMAHIRSHGAGGSDLPSNCRLLCHRCHMAEHAGRIPRPIHG